MIQLNNIKKTDAVLMDLGIYPNKNAFQYIKTYIDMQNDLPNRDLPLAAVYEKIAEKYNVTPKIIHDSIKRALKFANVNGKLKNIDNYFGINLYNEKQPLTNSEFLSFMKILFTSNSSSGRNL